MKGDLSKILDPNTFTPDGTAAIAFTSFSESDKLIAYGICFNGSQWKSIHILNMENLQQSPETLNKTRVESVAWTHDDLGFFYSVSISNLAKIYPILFRNKIRNKR